MSICYNCFKEINEAEECPFCGYENSSQGGAYPMALEPGSILNGRYIIGRVLGQGGFGITYLAQNYSTGEIVAIKEYLPGELAARSSGTHQVKPFSTDYRESYEYGKDQFLQEAKTLANFIGIDNIVRVHSFFEENNTAYLAMDFVNGIGLDSFMKQHGGSISVEDANRLLLPICDALEIVHAKGIVHRDIAPDNILISSGGAVAKLIDFGAARYSVGEKSKSLDVILKHGFAPIEQYSRHGRQGPYTDVYALAATYYYAISGKIPQDSIDRMSEDELILPSRLNPDVWPELEEALLKALEVQAKNRYQSMAEMRESFNTAIDAESDRNLVILAKKHKEEEQRRIAEEKRLAEEKRKEELRLAEEKRKEEQRLAEQKRAEEKRLAEEKRREEKRLAEEKKAEEKRLAEEKKAEAKRAAEQKRAEEKRLAEEKKAEQKRLAEEKKAEQKRLADAQKAEVITESSAEAAETRAIEAKPAKKKNKAIIAVLAAAAIAACLAAVLIVTKTIIPNNNYNAAAALMNSGDYESAIEAFTALNGYKDSAEQIAACENEIAYQNAVELENAEKYEESLAAFEALNGYKDSAKQIELCNTAIKNIEDNNDYNAAISLKESGDLSGAYAAFAELGDYKDSQIQKELVNSEILRAAEIGSTVFFGSYEQDNDLTNGAEDVEWLVLDKQDGKILVISKYALDSQPYNSTLTDVTWETCSLREWLNGTFLQETFTEAEQTAIPTITVTADKNPKYATTAGNDTQDQIFLLSVNEAKEYFYDYSPNSLGNPTEYARNQDVIVTDSYGNCNWWLRSPGSNSACASSLTTQGLISNSGSRVNREGYCIRPALWIDLEEYNNSLTYRSALSLKESGELASAAELFSELGDYKDSRTQLESVKSELLINAEVGDTVFFGSYEQDNDTSNGKEDIEWIVLDKEENQILVISRYALDCKPYNSSYTNVTWETCSLRSWLNETFRDAAFSSEEAAKIAVTNVTADKNPEYDTNAGNDTQDRVFVLSIHEAEQYFVTDEARLCEPTAYAKAQGAYVNGPGNCWWWLRSPGSYSISAADVHGGGSIDCNGNSVYISNGSIRPAMWINLES